jgi:pimeloyl-ACP methyl ester carboxylesterase
MIGSRTGIAAAMIDACCVGLACPGRHSRRASAGPRDEGERTMSDTATAVSYAATKNVVISARDGVDYVYRVSGAGGTPLVLLNHWRGNLDNWDWALVNKLAANRKTIAFDNRGVGGSSGLTPSTISEMATDAITFIEALGLAEVDILGFSIGSFVAQEIALIRPSLVRKLVLASSAPQGGRDMFGWADWVVEAVGKPQTSPEEFLSVFFARTETSVAAGRAAAGRIYGTRTMDRDQITSWQTRVAQYDAVCKWGQPNHALLERVSAIIKPTFVANGDSDPMILPHFSYLLAGLIPGAKLKIYPDSAHGFLYQHHEEFGGDVNTFLDTE